MKIACVGYRSWALNIYEKIIKTGDHKILLQSSENLFNEKDIYDFSPDLILFYGWSKIVPEKIINDFICLMLHPSDLPKFRGGSPIQNQMIQGIKETKITIFRMNEELDSGDIVAKGGLDLSGHMHEIFQRLTDEGARLTLDFLEKGLSYKKQDHSSATYYKRRTPEQSEITSEELATKDSDYLFNKIRMLEDPYPNAFLKTADGKKILIKLAEPED
tara:strand:- start:18987 stop:19637 length:651 start_codon:yes stop_codon:yes gene_type:complete